MIDKKKTNEVILYDEWQMTKEILFNYEWQKQQNALLLYYELQSNKKK